jgi:hypothetical protein
MICIRVYQDSERLVQVLKSDGGGETQKRRQHGDLISLLLFFFQNKESTPKIGANDFQHLLALFIVK